MKKCAGCKTWRGRSGYAAGEWGKSTGARICTKCQGKMRQKLAEGRSKRARLSPETGERGARGARGPIQGDQGRAMKDAYENVGSIDVVFGWGAAGLLLCDDQDVDVHERAARAKVVAAILAMRKEGEFSGKALETGAAEITQFGKHYPALVKAFAEMAPGERKKACEGLYKDAAAARDGDEARGARDIAEVVCATARNWRDASEAERTPRSQSEGWTTHEQVVDESEEEEEEESESDGGSGSWAGDARVPAGASVGPGGEVKKPKKAATVVEQLPIGTVRGMEQLMSVRRPWGTAAVFLDPRDLPADAQFAGSGASGEEGRGVSQEMIKLARKASRKFSVHDNLQFTPEVEGMVQGCNRSLSCGADDAIQAAAALAAAGVSSSLARTYPMGLWQASKATSTAHALAYTLEVPAAIRGRFDKLKEAWLYSRNLAQISSTLLNEEVMKRRKRDMESGVGLQPCRQPAFESQEAALGRHKKRETEEANRIAAISGDHADKELRKLTAQVVANELPLDLGDAEVLHGFVPGAIMAFQMDEQMQRLEVLVRDALRRMKAIHIQCIAFLASNAIGQCAEPKTAKYLMMKMEQQAADLVDDGFGQEQNHHALAMMDAVDFHPVVKKRKVKKGAGKGLRGKAAVKTKLSLTHQRRAATAAARPKARKGNGGNGNGGNSKGGQHGYNATIVCRNFANGACSFGANCQFMHGNMGGGGGGGGNANTGGNANSNGGGSGGANGRTASQKITAAKIPFPPDVWILNVGGEIRAYKKGCSGTTNKAEVEDRLRTDPKSIPASEYSTTNPPKLQSDFAWIKRL